VAYHVGTRRRHLFLLFLVGTCQVGNERCQSSFLALPHNRLAVCRAARCDVTVSFCIDCYTTSNRWSVQTSQIEQMFPPAIILQTAGRQHERSYVGTRDTIVPTNGCFAPTLILTFFHVILFRSVGKPIKRHVVCHLTDIVPSDAICIMIIKTVIYCCIFLHPGRVKCTILGAEYKNCGDRQYPPLPDP